MFYTKKATRGVSLAAQILRTNEWSACGSTSSLARTPLSNTGLDSQDICPTEPPKFSISVDWLDFSFRAIASAGEAYDLVHQLEIVLATAIDFSCDRPTHNGMHWDGSGHGNDGLLLWYRQPHENEFCERVPAQLKIALPGSALGPTRVRELSEWLVIAGDRTEIDCSRIDVALDDHDKLVKLGRIAEARRDGNFFNATYTERTESGKRGEIEGVTLYFGAKSSDKRLCIYDKTIESKGKILGNRWEARFRRKAACEVFSLWLSTITEGEAPTCRLLQNVVLGLIDFRDRTGADPNRERCDRLGWFAHLLSILSATPARISAAKIVLSAQKSVRWLGKSVASTLAGVRCVLKEDFREYLSNLIDDGASKMSNLRRQTMLMTDKEELLY
jgi:hypothetical protein